MLIYLYSLGVLAAITFLIQTQLYNHAQHETSGTDHLEDMDPVIAAAL